jgi:hypothetical protein
MDTTELATGDTEIQPWQGIGNLWLCMYSKLGGIF